MSYCDLKHPQAVRGKSSDSIQINFLTPKQEAPPMLSREHFLPERLLSWTTHLSIQISRQLNFSVAIQTARRRLGLSNDCTFYFNCLPEHAKISGRDALEVIPTNTPAQEDLPAGVQVYIFVSSSRTASSDQKTDSKQGGRRNSKSSLTVSSSGEAEIAEPILESQETSDNDE